MELKGGRNGSESMQSEKGTYTFRTPRTAGKERPVEEEESQAREVSALIPKRRRGRFPGKTEWPSMPNTAEAEQKKRRKLHVRVNDKMFG